ncbi:UDP-2,3-diacylglucosamine diphosphatase LpxI [Roseobacter sp. YSTF-M11]|uniref:UDP-2,3-diacylglucosamine diphosphatase LpxI n=1 Tax=Roseobacter insulae TaxID=2859783 RepID=A0A9X1FWC6_9RHOB|nr:UDP-2,3-diacylglucosamine diphosphatase LpxI [Roseobacter insulae]MBW4708776.1 UDP-2,3-diacylglucosamine diphosphatase LpxI [Roseobacter insulae]
MLALIAGRGGLPARIAGSQPKPPYICVMDGFDPDALQADKRFRLEHLGTLLTDLADHGITDICFCGAIERPAFDPAALDAATMPLVPEMMQAMATGDDSALRAFIGIFESRGFTIRAAHDLAPDILVAEGVHSAAPPDEQMQADADRGAAVLEALAPLDVGQGCVVGGGQVWAIETLGGTDHMLRSLPEKAAKARAIMVKAPKRGQDLRVDMPTIGPATITALAGAGLAGLVVEAGGVILLEPEATRAAADAAGLVLWARPAS